MKIFLFEVTLYDGTHEHRELVLIKAKDQHTAWKLGEGQLHDVGEEDNGKYWNYGDGETATRARWIVEISKEDAQVLSRLNIVNFLN